MSADLVVGLGCRPGVAEANVRAAVRALLARYGLDPAAIRAYATLDSRVGEPGLRAVTGPRLLGFPAEVLGAVPVPNPSDQVAKAVGTASVAEAAALHAASLLAPAGGRIELVAAKLISASVTAAAASIHRR